MAQVFENRFDPEAEGDRRSSSASGSEPLGGPHPLTGRSPEASAPETRKDLGGEDEVEGSIPETFPVAGIGRATHRKLVKPTASRSELTPERRLLILDCWKRSGLPGTEFASIAGVCAMTLYQWKRRFESEGPAGLLDKPRGPGKGSKLPELTRRTILMLKDSNPDWGCQRISDMLLRGPALPASPGAVATVLKEAGYVLEESPTRPHPDHLREFERAKPNQLWQSDLFTFVLKRQNRRVYLVAFLDDHSRYLVSYGLYGSQSTALVLEVLRAGIANYQAPEEVLTDQGAQYHTWRGKGAFTKELEGRGIRQILARPRHPQTLGKIERFWGSLWRECLEHAVFIDVDDARRRVGLYIDHYNFQRPHQGIGGLVPADRYFSAAPEVLRTLKERVAANALDLARQGEPRSPFYLTGQVGGKSFSVHAEGERVILRHDSGQREEVDLVAPAAGGTSPAGRIEEPQPEPPAPLCPSSSPAEEAERGAETPPPPGASPFDEAIRRLRRGLDEEGGAA